jgi:hypothetical protein
VRLDELKPHLVVVKLLIAGYLLEELIAGYLLEELAASQLLRPIILILQAFIVRISLRANPDDRVVVDGVSIGGLS